MGRKAAFCSGWHWGEGQKGRKAAVYAAFSSIFAKVASHKRDICAVPVKPGLSARQSGDFPERLPTYRRIIVFITKNGGNSNEFLCKFRVNACKYYRISPGKAHGQEI
ncbi:MAG: hypothetical protein LUD78_00535 [Clostridiales bacterium]|nr:hypothetical protein [Clostridiales bacterium]